MYSMAPRWLAGSDMLGAKVRIIANGAANDTHNSFGGEGMENKRHAQFRSPARGVLHDWRYGLFSPSKRGPLHTFLREADAFAEFHYVPWEGYGYSN